MTCCLSLQLRGWELLVCQLALGLPRLLYQLLRGLGWLGLGLWLRTSCYRACLRGETDR